MVTIDCPPQILVVSDNRKGLISNADRNVASTHSNRYNRAKTKTCHLPGHEHVICSMNVNFENGRVGSTSNIPEFLRYSLETGTSVICLQSISLRD